MTYNVDVGLVWQRSVWLWSLYGTADIVRSSAFHIITIPNNAQHCDYDCGAHDFILCVVEGLGVCSDN